MFDDSPCYALQGVDGQPLLHRAESLTLQAVNNIRKLRLQARPDAQINPAQLESLLGSVLPKSPLERIAGEPAAYWLGPNDWLLLDPATDTGSIGNAWQEASGGATSVVIDVTGAWSIIDISGADTAAKLAQGCSVDLDPGVFPPGRFALTRLQHLSVIIHRLDDTPRFRILADRSVARFLWDWLMS